MKTGSKKPSQFVRIVSAPIRVLGKAQDLYVRTLSDCADRFGCGNTGLPGEQYPGLPRSFSANSSRSGDSDDLRELIRAASTRSFGERIDVEAVPGRRDPSPVRRPSLGTRVLPKSSSVGMGRIDEDRQCEFDQDGIGAMELDGLYHKSKSCVVGSTRGIVGAEEEAY